MKKQLQISFFEKRKGIAQGFYAFKEPNIWYPVMYFRKAKYANKKEYELIVDYIRKSEV